MASITVSIVIPVFNQREITKACWQAIQLAGGPSFEVIIVDNNSTDGAGDMALDFPGAIVIKNSTNEGYLGVNRGAAVARGRYMVFLNNDTVPQPGWLKELVATAERTPGVGVVGAKLISTGGQILEAGGMVWRDGTAWACGRGDNSERPLFNYQREVDYCSGACLLVPTEVFRRLGGFDQRYRPGYYEDVDLGFAVRRHGLRVLYQPRAVVVHYEGCTGNSAKAALMDINRDKFRVKWRRELRRQPEFNPKNPVIERQQSRRVLFSDYYLPMPDRDAGSARMYWLMQLAIQAGHEVAFLALDGRGQEQYQQRLRAAGITLTVGEGRAPREILAALPGKVPEVAYISHYYTGAALAPVIRELWPDCRVVIDSVDLHYLRLARQADVTGSASLRDEACRTRVEELAALALADVVIAVTEAEAAIIRLTMEQARVVVVPTIHPVSRGLPFSARTGLVFVGNFLHHPNVDAVLFLVREIWPQIRAALHCQLFLVGNQPPPEISGLAAEDITITGYVPDIQTYLNRCRVALAPLRFGAGIKGKVGEALAAGLPVVATPMAVEGMGLEHGRHLLLAKSPDEFAAAVIRVYHDPRLWRQLAATGQELASRIFSPEAVLPLVKAIFSPSTGLFHRM